jgi:hypothetical protein
MKDGYQEQFRAVLHFTLDVALRIIGSSDQTTLKPECDNGRFVRGAIGAYLDIHADVQYGSAIMRVINNILPTRVQKIKLLGMFKK